MTDVKMYHEFTGWQPTDIIHLDHEQDCALIDLWESNFQDKRTINGIPIPADLFISKTLPLHNFAVVIDERGQLEDGRINMALFRIADDELYGVPQMIHLNDGPHNIKYVLDLVFAEAGMYPQSIWVKLGYEEGDDRLFGFEFTALNGSEHRPLDEETVKRGCLHLLMGGFMETWYGIEVAMLHPTVKDVFLHPKVKKDKISKRDRAAYGHKIYRYVKHHYITDEELNDAIYGKESHPFNRKALIWYVSGHWREYKTGKKVFIQPYWKGALRATKKAETRNREIVIEKEVTT